MANAPTTISVKVDMDTAEVRAATLKAATEAYDRGCRETYEWILARQNGENWDEPTNPYRAP